MINVICSLITKFEYSITCSTTKYDRGHFFVERTKKSENEIQRKMCNLEESNRLLQESVIDLKARSMRDNLLFYNVEEEERENTDEKIYQILEEKLQIPDARSRIS
jgi:hypothetical protein